jgi:hypothetical protein
MKKFFILLLLVTNYSFAQTAKLKWSEESKVDNIYNSFVKGTDNDIIKLCFSKKGNKTIEPVFSRFDKNLKLVNEESYLADSEGTKFNEFKNIGGKLFLFTNYYDKSSKTKEFFSQSINIKTLTVEGDKQSLGVFDAVKASNQSDISTILSADSSKVLIMNEAPYEKNEAEKFDIGVYNTQMKKLWNKTITLPYKDKSVTLFGSIVTNDGKVGVLLKHYDQNDKRGEGKNAPAYTIKLLLYSKESDAIKEIAINLGNKFMHSISTLSEKENEILMFGLYRTKTYGNINGYFTTKIDVKNTKAEVTNMNEFSSKLSSLVDLDNQGSDNDKDPGLGSNFRLVKTINRENGAIDHILEFAFWTIVTSMPNPSTGITTRTKLYKSGDIIDICINKDGKTVVTRIPKAQTSGYDIYSGFQVLPYKDKLVFFYNDDESNIKTELNKRVKGFNMSNNVEFVMATIDKDGNLFREILIDHKSSKNIIAVNASFRIDKNKIALYANHFNLFASAKDLVGILELE